MLIIDPPIFRFASANEIRAYLKELDETEREIRSDPQALRQIAEVRGEAEEWLRRKGEGSAGGGQDRQ